MSAPHSGVVTEVGVYEAKTRLSDLINRVMAGEHVTITVRGEPVVELVPCARRAKAKKARAVSGLLALMDEAQGKYRAMSQAELKAAMEEGRR